MKTTVTLKDFANLVATVGRDVTVIGQGEPGMGKSAMLSVIAERTGLKPVYVDCQLLDLGDLQMPAADLEARMIRFMPNELFAHDEPIVLMLDEVGKAMRPVQNALLPLLLEKRIGVTRLHPDSIVFGTTNLASDGVGDALQAHARNRVCFVQISKPTADEWLEWAANNDVAPEVMAWVREYPHCLASYTDGDDDNPYVFNPKRTKAAFVSPRSLHKASHIVAQRLHLSPDTLIASLAGTIGEAAARDMQAFLQLADALPEWARIMRDPETAPVPESPIAQSILAFSAVTRLKAEEVDAWLTYVVRLKTEVAAMFVSQAMRTQKAVLLVKNAKFTQYCRQFHWVYS